LEAASTFQIESRINKRLPQKHDRMKINTISNSISAAGDYLNLQSHQLRLAYYFPRRSEPISLGREQIYLLAPQLFGRRSYYKVYSFPWCAVDEHLNNPAGAPRRDDGFHRYRRK
jgi:hypothetical protein